MDTPIYHQIDNKQFALAVRKLANSLSFGNDHSLFLGAGVDYVQSRLYQTGDSVKYIDWKITARTGKVYIKEFEAPKRIDIYFLVDTSASMVFSSGELSKYALSLQLAIGLALVSLKRMSPVGVMACGERPLHIRPTLSKDTIWLWAEKLKKYSTTEKTSLIKSLEELLVSLKSRSLIVVLSDLHEPGCIDTLKTLYQQHDIMVLQLLDIAEKGNIGGGIFHVQEAETGKSFVSHGSKKWLDPDCIVTSLQEAGIDTLQLQTNQPILEKLRNFLKYRSFAGRKGI